MALLFILGIALFLFSLMSGSDSYGYRGPHRPHRSTVIMSDPYNDDRYEYWHYRQEHQRSRATILFLAVLVGLLFLNSDGCHSYRTTESVTKKERTHKGVPDRAKVETIAQVPN